MVYMVEGKDPVVRQYYPCTPQMVELQIVIEVIKDYDFPFNLISDSQYVVNLVLSLKVAGPIKALSTIQALALQLQKLLLERRQPLYVRHIHAHSGLPRPLSRRNDIVDNCTHMEFIYLASPIELASQFHSKFHVNAKTLQRKFRISRAQARDVVTTCGHCLEFQHPPSYEANPRGLLPLQVWQMDVKHFSKFGKLKYVHVSIDTCSRIVYASPMAGEKASHVIQHCLEAWAAWGKPQQLKTDNGPTYTAKTLVSFCQQMEVQVKHGLTYNSQDQRIVERAYRTLKELLVKQKGGIGYGHTQKIRIFLQLDKEGCSAAERHANTSSSKLGYAKWKDVLTRSWNGPDPVLA
jgi:transposase InsO family protein